MQFSWMNLQGGLHMSINGRPYAVAKDSEHYAAVCKAIQEKQGGEAILDILEADKRRMEAAIEVTPNIRFNGGTLLYKDEPVHGVMGSRMLEALNEGFELTAMAAFLENLMQNPSKTVVDNLYAFLEQGKNTFTEDGCFLAYKAVREDYLDIYTSTYDNSVGQVLAMSRNRVDEDRHRTCSFGYHVCSFEYLPHFAHANGHVMVCKVNPADVVAIPVDYNNTKMRVCKYEVIGEIEDYYDKREDVLAAATVAADHPFVVEVDYGNGAGFVATESFNRLSEASAEAEDLAENADIDAVRVINRETGSVLFAVNDIGRGEGDNDDDDDDVDNTFTVFGISDDGEAVLLDDGFETLSAALSYVFDVDVDEDGYVRVEVRDADGDVVKTIS